MTNQRGDVVRPWLTRILSKKEISLHTPQQLAFEVPQSK
jgi:hypothetical protein